jgi:hypothetical protein
MRIKALLATHDLSEEAMPWMAEARSIFDELVIFIDEERVTRGSTARAQKVATRVHRHRADTWYEWDLGAMARQCESDWVFIIERDEQLSPEWQQGQWRQILETTQVTHFWAPRRWIVPGQRYINCEPWWPDFQLRLLQSNLDGTVFPTRLHDPIQVPGPGGYLSNLAIHHHVLWLCSRTTREDRVRYYEQLRPGGALGHYYLYENYRPPEASLPTPTKLNINGEVCWMEKLQPKDVSKLSFKVSGVPNVLRPSEMFWVDGEVINATSENICACPPFPVSLSYHWIQQATGQTVIFDGNRSGLFPGIPANASMQYRMLIIAPTEPGEYILQTTMVQDGVRWFEDVEPKILQEFALTLVAGDNKPPPFAKTKA